MSPFECTIPFLDYAVGENWFLLTGVCCWLPCFGDHRGPEALHVWLSLPAVDHYYFLAKFFQCSSRNNAHLPRLPPVCCSNCTSVTARSRKPLKTIPCLVLKGEKKSKCLTVNRNLRGKNALHYCPCLSRDRAEKKTTGSMLHYSHYQAINQWKSSTTNTPFDSEQPLLATSRVCWFLNFSMVHYSKRYPPIIIC